MAVTPRFEATISADISKFMQRAATVDKTIKKMATGVIVDIGADISGFMRRAATVQATAAAIASSSPTVNVNANTGGFLAQAATVQAATAAIASSEPTVTIDADTAVASAQVTGFLARLRAMTAQNFVVRMRASWNNYQQVMGQMATFSRNFGEFTGMIGRGGMMLVSPAAIPVLASAVGLIGNLGPMLGTVAGSTFALVSAFGTAGIGAAAFGAIAVTNLKDIFGASEELKKLDEKLAKADDWKERQKIMQEIKQVQGSLNDEQTKGLEAMNKLKSTWSGIAGSLQAQTIQIFTSALSIMSGVLTDLKPLFSTVMDAAQNLTKSLGAAINAEPMQNFFNYLNTTAGPMLETITKAVGNFFQGFFSMMTAFGPLATETAGGFLKMSESFAAWGASLSENKQFQAFTSYVSENMPKIRSIFGDAIKGIINMFAAFGGSSSDMMTNLQDMMGRFREWSAALGESQGFKNFIDYIQTNGPVVVSTIGEIVDFIINLGKAAAPMGEKMLGMINGMMDFANGMLEAHPWLGKLSIAMVVLGGAFLATLPTVALLNALLGGLITKMIVSTAKTVWATGVQVAKWIWMGTMATLNAIKVAAAWTLSTGIAMVTAVAKMIASAAVFVARWTLMGVQALLHAAKVAAGWALATGVAMVTAVAKMIASAAVFVARWTLMGAQAMIHAAKVAAAWVLSTGAAMATAVAGMIATAATFVARWTFMAVQALAQAARMAAAWLIAMGPIGWATAAVLAIAALVIANWDKISAWTKKAWTAVSDSVTQAWEKAKSKTTEIASAIWNTTKDKFASVVSSVKEKMESAKSTVQNKWEEAKSATMTKIASIVTTVTTKFAEIVQKVTTKMTEAKTAIQNKWEEAKTAAITKIAAMVTAVASKFAEIVSKVTAKMSEAKTALSNKWEEAKSATSTKLSALVTAVTTFFTNVVSKVREKMAEAVTTLGSKVAEMPGKVLSYVGEMLSAGSDLVSGLINGIKNMGSAAVEAISGVVGGVIGKAKSLLKINSPSRVFTDFGAFVSEGLAIGVESKAQAAVSAVSDMANAMTSAFRPQFSTAGVSINGGALDAGSQMDQLSAQVKRELAIDMTVNHSGSVGGGGSASGGDTYYITVDAKNIKELNDLTRLFDKQRLRQQ